MLTFNSEKRPAVVCEIYSRSRYKKITCEPASASPAIVDGSLAVDEGETVAVCRGGVVGFNGGQSRPDGQICGVEVTVERNKSMSRDDAGRVTVYDCA